MPDSNNSVDEKAAYFASFSPDDLLRAIRSDCRQPLINARGYCQILMTAGDDYLTPDKRKELAEHILHVLDGIEQVLDISAKALHMQEANKKAKGNFNEQDD
jgi:hypothetical protein